MPSLNPRRLRWMQIGGSQDFSGGPNVRDAPTELAPNEATDAWNVTYDERGGVSSRRGYVKDNGTPFGAGVIHNKFWSSILAAQVTQAGASLYLAGTNTIRKTFTTAALVTFAELNALVVACHPVDGLFTSADGITWTAVADVDAPKGTCVFAFQGKLWVGLPDGSVHWSAINDPTSWVATDFNKLWEKDTQPIVALHLSTGQDILGQPGLLAFKQESTYRISDATTGEYTTVDATVGAAGPLAVGGVGPKVLVLCKHGIFWWEDGLVGMQNATDQVRPLWDSLQINLAQQNLWCFGREGNRAIFSLTRAGSTANDMSLRFHPDQKWIAPGSDAMSCYATATGTSDLVYGGSPTVTGQGYLLDSGGTDDGAAIAWRFQTRWFDLAGGFLTGVWQARMHGRGAGTMSILKDYQATDGDDRIFNVTAPATQLWDSGLHWDTGLTWGVDVFQAPVAFFSIGKAKQLALKFTGSSTTTATAPVVFGGGAGPAVGAFALYGIEFAYWWLGYDS